MKSLGHSWQSLFTWQCVTLLDDLRLPQSHHMRDCWHVCKWHMTRNQTGRKTCICHHGWRMKCDALTHLRTGDKSLSPRCNSAAPLMHCRHDTDGWHQMVCVIEWCHSQLSQGQACTVPSHLPVFYFYKCCHQGSIMISMLLLWQLLCFASWSTSVV